MTADWTRHGPVRLGISGLVAILDQTGEGNRVKRLKKKRNSPKQKSDMRGNFPSHLEEKPLAPLRWPQ